MNSERHWSELVIPMGFGLGTLGIVVLSVAIEKVGKRIGELSMEDLVYGLDKIGETARKTEVPAFCAEAGTDLVSYLMCGNEKLLKLMEAVEGAYLFGKDALETFAGGVVEVVRSIGTDNFGSVVGEHQAISLGLILVLGCLSGSLLYSLNNVYTKSPKI